MENQNNWLPPEYEKPASNSRYLKLQQGDNKIRILSAPITGWVDWTEQDGKRMPVRTKEQQPAINPSQPPRHFWSFVVWDYQEKNVKILEITQATIQDAIYSLQSTPEWGSPTNYDITIKKTGEKMETRYNVVAIPPQPVAQEIKEAYELEVIDLNELYNNGDPFKGVKTEDEAPTPTEEPEINTENIPFN